MLNVKYELDCCDRLKINEQPINNAIHIECYGYFFWGEGYYDQQKMVDFVETKYKTGQLMDTIVPELNGCFQLRIVDGFTNTISIVQDRFGTYPFFCKSNNECVQLASDYRCLTDESSNYDDVALIEMATFGHAIGSKTLIDNVKELKPHNITVFYYDQQKGLSRSEHSYWHYELKDEGGSFKQKSKEFAELWNSRMDAICDALRDSNKSVHLALTGGLDSRLLAHALDVRKVNQSNLTYGYGIENKEKQVAFEISRHLKHSTKHTFLNVDEKIYAKMINETPQSFRLTGSHFSEKDLWFPYKEKNQLSCFMPGHSGDTMAGSHLRTKMQFWKDEFQVIDYIIKFKSTPAGKQLYNENKEVADVLTQSVFADVEDYGDSLISKFMRWNFEERQRRYVVRSVMAENWTDLPLVVMPFFDHEIFDFFTKLPFRFLLDQKLYRHSAYKHILGPKNVFAKTKVNGASLKPRVNGTLNEYYKKVKKVLNFDQYNFKVFSDEIAFDDYIDVSQLPSSFDKAIVRKDFYKTNGRLYYSITRFCEEFNEQQKK